MRPIRLEMTAFGPFVGTEVIQFNELGDNPLFLINGATGSGKTTILDAICFALYGETTGNERQAKEMRCDHAEDATLTSVEFLFELGESTYRISRIPEQERPTKRGEGFTRQQPKAELYMVLSDGAEELLVPSKISEANSRVVELTGLSAEQFRQVMVLPQGKFRELLLADSGDREKIFQQLFQTQIYRNLEFKLKDKANLIYREVKALEQRTLGILETVDAASIEELNQTISELKERAKAFKETKKNAAKKHETTLDNHAQGRELELKFTDLETAVNSLNALEQQQAVFQEKKEQEAAAQKARELHPMHDRYRRSQEALDGAMKQWDTASEDVKHADEQLVVARARNESSAQKKPLRDQKQKEGSVLEGYRERSAKLANARNALEDANTGLANKKAEQEHQQKTLQEYKARFGILKEEKEKLSGDAIALPRKKVELEKLQQAVSGLESLAQEKHTLEELTKKLAILEANLTDAEQALQEKARKRHLKEKAWQEGQGALLATGLVAGEPCPVCGSKDHPYPAHSNERVPTEADVREARKQEETARQARESCHGRVLECKSSKETTASKASDLTSSLGAVVDEPLSVHMGRLENLSGETATLQACVNQKPQLEQTLRELEARIKRAEKSLVEIQQGVSLAGNTIAAAMTDVTNKEAEIPEAYRDPESLEKAIEKNALQLKEMVAEIEEAQNQSDNAALAKKGADTWLRSAQKQTDAASKNHAGDQSEWQNILAGSAFESEAAFLGALLQEGVLAKLKEGIRLFEDNLLAARTKVKQLKGLLEGRERPDMVKLQSLEQEAAAALAKAEKAFYEANERKKHLKDARTILDEMAKARGKLEAEYNVVGYLSDIANGRNAHNLSLQRFVLSVLLDDVLVSASQRLDSMSRGRYQLLRKEDVGDRRSVSGLELEVEDAYSGKPRPVATLSGGESFMAALALALGLSDVVQSYSGGIRLDTLFIDEGFGSLDSESLDLAINTLIDLQASGRMIGVISHVPELKERIDVRLDVIADRSGSTTRLVTP